MLRIRSRQASKVLLLWHFVVSGDLPCVSLRDIRHKFFSKRFFFSRPFLFFFGGGREKNKSRNLTKRGTEGEVKEERGLSGEGVIVGGGELLGGEGRNCGGGWGWGDWNG